MAEQIRSFWSHLCGIFGAIFGIIAGGSVVVVKEARADKTYYYNKTLSNGAVVNYAYGRNYYPYRVYYSGNGPCLKSCETDNTCSSYYRYYVTFLGCADGYYATGLVTGTTNVTPYVGYETSNGGIVMSSGSLYHQGVCEKRALCNNSSMTDVACSGNYSSNYTGQTMSWKADPVTQTDGLCAPCPTYGEYLASTPSGMSFNTNVAACFMSPNTERSDAVEHDGVATGNFIWTTSCAYTPDGDVGLTPFCDEFRDEDGDCLLYLTSVGSNPTTTVRIIANLYGGVTNNTSHAQQEVDYVKNNKKETLLKNTFHCGAAQCYRNALLKNGDNARIEYYYD